MAPVSKATPAKATVPAKDTTPEGTGRQDEIQPQTIEAVKAVADEFADVVLIEAEKIEKVIPLDDIPESIRAHVALAVKEGAKLIPTVGWDKAKIGRYTRMAKSVTPHLPGGKRVKVVPSKTKDGRPALGVEVYTPRTRAPKTEVPPVEGAK